jgi:2-polyprenyl-3-methyl-5-hydroxy-6-metoxy-1,4-benzoquinol methylase
MPTPELIWSTINAYQSTAALKTAVELDLFTAIGEGVNTAAALARRTGAAERGIRILCDYLVIGRLLAKDNQTYSLTPDSAVFLDRRSPASLADSIRFLNSPLLMESFDKLTAAVRRGGTAVDSEGTMAREHPIWVEFARSMVPIVRPGAEAIARLVKAPKKILDIAAGHGMFGITLARDNPQAEVVAVDWDAVLALARQNARAAGLDGRYHTLPGSAFEVDFGSGYDVALLTNFFHHFDPPTCQKLMTKVRRALAPNGRAVTLEFVPNDDRVTPPPAAAFSLIMLATTASGDAYTFQEYDAMFRASGFSRNELHPIENYPGQLILSSP